VVVLVVFIAQVVVSLVVLVVVVLVSHSLLVELVQQTKVSLVEMVFGRVVSPIHRLLVVEVELVLLESLQQPLVLVEMVELVFRAT
jgi:uncharacterized membrane protein required for colicin V production